MDSLETLLERAELESIEALLEHARSVGWTQHKLATALGINERTVRRWASGASEIRLLDYLRLVELLRGATKPP